MVSRYSQKNGGFSLVEALIVSAIMLIVFGGLISGVKYTLDLISVSRAKLTALTVANNQMEYIHSLSYNTVGTVAGIPPGPIPQVSTTSLNQIVFTRTTLIEYIDDDADGVGAADSNGITTDYKQAKVTVSWEYRGIPYEIFLVSNLIPRSIETSVGGGTLRINVFDKNIAPLPGATVRLINTSGTSSIDVTRTTDATGIALFGGAPAGADYQVFVSAPGYSADQTYVATTSLPNPTTRPATVLESDITTMNFFIDRLSDVQIITLGSQVEASSTEEFNTAAGIATSTDTLVTAGQLVLRDVAGVYQSTGSAQLALITPSSFLRWHSVTVDTNLPAGTSYLLRLYTGTSTPTLIPEGDLPGNSAGFSAPSIDISMLDPVVYPNLTLGLTVSTSNTAVTPQIHSIKTWYIESETIEPNVTLTLTGEKTIGTLADTSLVYKTVIATTTNGSGVRNINDIEWDGYTVRASGYDVREACPANPVIVDPNSDVELSLILTSNSSHSLRVVVQDSTGVVQPDAVVALTQGVFSSVRTTGLCGQVFFSGLTSAPDYDLSVTTPGLGTETVTAFDITGDVVQVVQY
jgi:type II secretory pathway pseudopilin PulG